MSAVGSYPRWHLTVVSGSQVESAMNLHAFPQSISDEKSRSGAWMGPHGYVFQESSTVGAGEWASGPEGQWISGSVATARPGHEETYSQFLVVIWSTPSDRRM